MLALLGPVAAIVAASPDPLAVGALIVAALGAITGFGGLRLNARSGWVKENLDTLKAINDAQSAEIASLRDRLTDCLRRCDDCIERVRQLSGGAT